jgi:membrane-associated phospholipid phosphatase
MGLSRGRSRFLLALAAVVGGTASPAWAREGVGPISASVERAVGAVLENGARGPAEPVVCGAGCSRLRQRNREDKKPYLGGKAAMGVGFVAGVAVGVGLGESSEPEGPPATLRGWSASDWVVVGTVATAWGSTRLFDRQPESLAGGRWSDCRSAEDALNGFDRSLAEALGGRRGRQQAARVSDTTLMAATALPFGLAVGANPDQRGRDIGVAFGTLAVNLALTDVVKRLADRPRPYTHFCRPYRPGDLLKEDAHFSFYSGHASSSFSMAVAAGMLSHYHGYRNEAWVWATGLTMATTTGVLRVVGDKHYATDVIVGAAAGAFVGWLVPRLHRPGERPQTSARTPEPPPATLTLPLRLGSASGEGALRAGFGTGPFLEATWRW